MTEPASDPANVIRNCRDDEPGDDEGKESWDNAAARSTCSSLEIGDSKGDSCRNCDLQENLPINTHHHSPLIPTDRNMSHEIVCRKKNRHGPKVCPMQPEDDECLNRAFPNFRAATQPSATLLDMGYSRDLERKGARSGNRAPWRFRACAGRGIRRYADGHAIRAGAEWQLMRTSGFNTDHYSAPPRRHFQWNRLVAMCDGTQHLPV